MVVKLVELLAEYGGVIGLLIGVPFILLCMAIVVLWRQNSKNQERLIKIIEQKVEADVKLESALNGLAEVIKAKGHLCPGKLL